MTVQAQHPSVWVNDLVGRKYALGGRGPDAFDCWGLLMHVFRDQRGIDLPDWNRGAVTRREVIMARQDAGAAFHGGDIASVVEHPEDWDVALVERPAGLWHAGLVIGHGVLHASSGHGVVFEPRGRFQDSNGLKYVRFWRWHG